MRKWNLPLTYAPKIQAVREGTCRQTIRVVGKAGRKNVGDLVSFHGYENGRGTPWTWRTEYTPFTEVHEIDINAVGIKTYGFDGYPAEFYLWKELDVLAQKDGIEYGTGVMLGRVLNSMKKLPTFGGVEAQVLRW